MIKVRYTLAIYHPGTTMLATSVKAGSDFDLALFVQDVRPPGTYVSWDGQTLDKLRGVWAAYANVVYNRNLAQVYPVANPQPDEPQLEVKYSSLYRSGMRADNKPGMIANLGAFDGFDQLGTDLLEVCRVGMKALWPAANTGTTAGAKITLNVQGVQIPLCETLVMGNWDLNPPEESDVQPSEIILGSALLTVTK